MRLWMGDDCRYGCPDVLGDADDNLFGFCPAKTFYAGQNKFPGTWYRLNVLSGTELVSCGKWYRLNVLDGTEWF